MWSNLDRREQKIRIRPLLRSCFARGGKVRKLSKRHLSTRARSDQQVRDEDRERNLEGSEVAKPWPSPSSLVSEKRLSSCLLPTQVPCEPLPNFFASFLQGLPPPTRFILENRNGEGVGGSFWFCRERKWGTGLREQPSVPHPTISL